MSAITEPAVTGEDLARAGLYGLLARLLYAAPDAALLQAIAGADEFPEAAPLAGAWQGLQAASVVMEADAAEAEHERLFIGLGQAEVMPYMSWHLTGFLMEEPLVKLRDDLAALGLERAPGVGEPEDHMAAICEVMRLLAAGDARISPAAVQQQRRFFDRHVRPWYGKFAAQLESAPGANYYRAVAALLRAFLDVEAQAFEMVI